MAVGVRGRAVVGLGVALACLGLAPDVRAQDLKGFGEIQFQEIEGSGVKRQSWVSVLQVDHATRWRERVDIRSQLEFRRYAVIDGLERNTVPRGSLQIAHSNFGVNGYYRPSRTTDVFGLNTRQQEAVVSGYLSRPGLPRADFNWTRRHRNAGSTTRSETTATTRNAHVAQTVGPLNLQGGYGDIVEEPREARFRRTTQRTYDAAASLQIVSSRRGSASTRYGFAQTRGNLASGARIRTTTHETATAGSLFLSRRSDVTLNYNYRRSTFEGQVRDHLDDHDGTLLLNVRPTTGLRVSAGGGVRTSRTAESEDVLGSLLLTLSADGRVRPGWTGVASASRSISWFPDGRRFTVNTGRGGAVLQLNRGLQFNADLTVSSTGDTASTDSRAVLQASGGLNAQPLPGLRFSLSNRVYRVGPDLGRARAHSVGTSFDLRWQPVRGLEWTGSVAETSPLSRGSGRIRTRQMNLRVAPGAKFQIDANWSRSDQARGDFGTAELVGREVISSRAVLALARLTRLTAGYNLADPGRRATRVRQFDIILTQNLGR